MPDLPEELQLGRSHRQYETDPLDENEPEPHRPGVTGDRFEGQGRPLLWQGLLFVDIAQQ